MAKRASLCEILILSKPQVPQKIPLKLPDLDFIRLVCMIKDRVEKEKGGGALRLLLLKIKCPYDEF